MNPNISKICHSLVVTVTSSLIFSTFAQAETCIVDDFDRETGLGSNWLSQTKFGYSLPDIVDGRLRITTNENGLINGVSFNKNIPHYANKLVVEFDYFSYSDRVIHQRNGGFGTAVVLSETGVFLPPKLGGGEGALGYAPRRNKVQRLFDTLAARRTADDSMKSATLVNESAIDKSEGFEKGWLAIGLDSEGEFLQAKNGRNSGFRFPQKNTVTVRGGLDQRDEVDNSDIGYAGYEYLTSNALTPYVKQYEGVAGYISNYFQPNSLSPRIANNGENQANRYRVVYDYSNATNAWVTVMRSTGADSEGNYRFEPLISRFDLLTASNANKPVVGAEADARKLILSFTATTHAGLGNLSNYQEIDNLSICSDINFD